MYYTREVYRQQEIKAILNKLNVPNVYELLATDFDKIDALSRINQLHSNVVIEMISRLRSLLTESLQYEGDTRKDNVFARLEFIVNNWVSYMKNNNNAVVGEYFRLYLRDHEIIEIIGVPGGGKSTLLNSIILESVRNGYSVLYLDSHHNILKLQHVLTAYWRNNVKAFHFTNISTLAMLIHSLGNQLSMHTSTDKFLLAIDCMSRVYMVYAYGVHNTGSMYFKSVYKLKKLLANFARIVGAIVYTYRTAASATLFETHYKNNKNRPKANMTNSKIWDSIASKTICVDFAMLHNKQYILKINLTKSLTPNIHIFERVPHYPL